MFPHLSVIRQYHKKCKQNIKSEHAIIEQLVKTEVLWGVGMSLSGVIFNLASSLTNDRIRSFITTTFIQLQNQNYTVHKPIYSDLNVYLRRYSISFQPFFYTYLHCSLHLANYNQIFFVIDSRNKHWRKPEFMYRSCFVNIKIYIIWNTFRKFFKCLSFVYN